MPGDHISKYADDSYLIMPPTNSASINNELVHVAQWASHNNLKLNQSKSTEMIVHKPRVKKDTVNPCAPIPGVKRVDSMVILGVTVQDNLSFDEHVNRIATQCAQQMYALRVLSSHGLYGQNMWEVTRSTLVSKIMYGSQVWWGFANASQQNRLQSILNRAIKQKFLPPNFPSLADLCEKADTVLFSNVLRNSDHVLYKLLPPLKSTGYSLRKRIHDRALPSLSDSKDSLIRKTFIHRMVYKDTY